MIGTVTEEYFIESYAHSTLVLGKLTRGEGVQHDVLAACVFHLTNILTLNIPFLQNLLIYLAFVDFGAVQHKLEQWWAKRGVRWAFGVLGVGMVLAHLALRSAGVGRWLLFVLDEVHDNPFVLRFSAALYVVAFVVVLHDLVRRWRAPSREPPLTDIPPAPATPA
jgi:hypothetical protein